MCFESVGGITALVELLKQDIEEIQSVAASVICNISENDEIRLALTDAQACPIIVSLLRSPVDDIQSRAAIIISDLACVDGNQVIFIYFSSRTSIAKWKSLDYKWTC